MVGSVGNIERCAKDVRSIVSNFESGFQDLKYGFSAKSISSIEDGFKEIASGGWSLYSSLNDCGIKSLYSDIKTIVDACEDPAALTKMLIKEAINIMYVNVVILVLTL